MTKNFCAEAEQTLIDTVQDLAWLHRNEIKHEIVLGLGNHKTDELIEARYKKGHIVAGYFAPHWCMDNDKHLIVFNELALDEDFVTEESGRFFYGQYEVEPYDAQKALAAHEFAHLLIDERDIKQTDSHDNEFESILIDLLDELDI